MNEQSEKIDQIIEKFKNEKGTIIGLMQDIHGEYRYLPEEVLLRVSAELDIPMANIYTLATFYKSFRLINSFQYYQIPPPPVRFPLAPLLQRL